MNAGNVHGNDNDFSTLNESRSNSTKKLLKSLHKKILKDASVNDEKFFDENRGQSQSNIPLSKNQKKLYCELNQSTRLESRLNDQPKQTSKKIQSPPRTPNLGKEYKNPGTAGMRTEPKSTDFSPKK